MGRPFSAGPMTISNTCSCRPGPSTSNWRYLAAYARRADAGSLRGSVVDRFDAGVAGFDRHDARDVAARGAAVDHDLPACAASARERVPPPHVGSPRARPAAHRATTAGQHRALDTRGRARLLAAARHHDRVT